MATKKVTNKITAAPQTQSLLERMESEVQSNQSRLSLVLGGLIILVVGVLVFNYFNRGTTDKAEISQTAEKTEAKEDVTPEKLPGKYTIKENDTLFMIAQKYYSDGYKYTEIAKANNITNSDLIEVGQVLDIPKLAVTTMVEPTPAPQAQAVSESFGIAITGDTYTVTSGDWLSTISARAYNGDVMSYSKIATANHITNPDLIEPGTVLTIPR